MQAPKPALSIRQASAEDLPRIAWLEDAAFADPWPFDLLAYEFGHPRGFLLVASWDDGPSVGYVAFRHGGGESEMLRLAVDPEVRRQGVARMLVESGLERLRREKVESCHLEVRMDNQGAIAFYEALGFQRSGRRKSYYRDGTNAALYSLAL
ncbi:MAG TPA: ribosomal protein S18-alanine N-acetyltransferase [Thermoanaerobaculia bacterium]|nr:ribosomal protein S18-alanine N-acetyltransferase [Thermoanaerobaculia bacterium]